MLMTLIVIMTALLTSIAFRESYKEVIIKYDLETNRSNFNFMVDRVTEVCGQKYIAYNIVNEAIQFGNNPWKMAAIAFGESTYRRGAHNTYLYVEEQIINGNKFTISNRRHVRGLYQLCLYTAVFMCEEKLEDPYLKRFIWEWEGNLYDVNLNCRIANSYVSWLKDVKGCRDEFDAYKRYYGGYEGFDDIDNVVNHYRRYYLEYDEFK